MNTDLLHKYFKGETTEQEESLIVEWVEESAENKARYLKERMLYDVSLFSDTTTGKKEKKNIFLYYIVPAMAVAAMFALLFYIGIP